MKAHENDFMFGGHQPHWECRDYDKEQHCSYCGSILPELAVALLGTPGVSFSGSDWKYGWPHKFYFTRGKDHFKFYNKHLQDIDDDVLAMFSALSEKFFHITWTRDANGLRWNAVPSIQMWGDVGADGEPDFSRMITT